MIVLWRYNTTTGYWNRQRECLPENAQQWLAVFQKDEPQAFFRLAKRRPNDHPTKTRT
jgi:hypothetical protein